MLSRLTLLRLVKLKAYRAVASLVSRDYFICGDDFGREAGEMLDLAAFLELVKERGNFFKVAKGVIELYKGKGSLPSILSCVRWTRDVRTVVASIYINELPDLVTIKDLILAVQFELLLVAEEIFKLHLEVPKLEEVQLSKTLVNALKKNGFL